MPWDVTFFLLFAYQEPVRLIELFSKSCVSFCLILYILCIVSNHYVSGKCLAVFSTRIKWCWCICTESFVWLIQGNLNIFLREVLLQATLVHFIWPALLNLLFCLIIVLETLWLKAHLHQNKFPEGLLLWWNGIN